MARLNNLVRGLLYGFAALLGAVVLVVIAIAVIANRVQPPNGTHLMIAINLAGPIGAGVLALLLLAFGGGFAFGARRLGAQGR